MNVLPPYQRIYLALRERVVNGVYNWSQAMPGEVMLADEFGVARTTVRKALNLLEDEGLVVRRQGKGTFVKAFSVDPAATRLNLMLATEQEDSQGDLSPDVSAHLEYLKPDNTISKQFDSASRMARITRVRRDKGKPYCFVETWLPVSTAEKVDWSALGNKPVITAVADAGHDFQRAEQTIATVFAGEDAAAALGIEIGAALLSVSALFIDDDGLAVMRKDGYFLPESFEYRNTVYKKR